MRPDLQRGDDPDRERRLARQHEARPAADEDRLAGAADRLDQLGQVVEIGLLRGVVLLAERQQPVLDDAGGQLVEGADVVERQLHPVGDGLEQLVVVDLPAQPLADHPGDRAGPGAGLAADADVLEPGDRAETSRAVALLVAAAEEPADARTAARR